jgi:WD40 repeat protein
MLVRDGATPTLLPAATGAVDALLLLPDQRVIAADAGQHLRIVSGIGTVLADLEMEARAQALRLSVDGRRILSLPKLAGRVAPPALWDAVEGRLVARLAGHDGRVFSARFVDSGIITAGTDGTVRLWTSDGNPVRVLRARGRYFTDAATIQESWSAPPAMASSSSGIVDPDFRSGTYMPIAPTSRACGSREAAL